MSKMTQPNSKLEFQQGKNDVSLKKNTTKHCIAANHPLSRQLLPIIKTQTKKTMKRFGDEETENLGPNILRIETTDTFMCFKYKTGVQKQKRTRKH